MDLSVAGADTVSYTHLALCGRLVRMIPGQAVKEIIAEDVDGYLVVDGTIYYAQGGRIHSATSGTETAVGEESYKVQIQMCIRDRYNTLCVWRADIPVRSNYMEI